MTGTGTAASPRRAAAVPLDAETIVIGAGFGGLGIALQLKQRGDDSFLILEKAHDVGGTWRDNVYPGCACDVPAALYSYSFAADTAWSRIYAQQPEILAYLRRTSADAGLREHIRFGSELAEARFDETDATWALQLRDGATLHCRILIVATGALSKPNVPAIPGAERFLGPSFHSARWDDSIDLSGKAVAVVGTGASAIQFVPQIAPRVGRLTIFQRSPPWIVPRNDKPVGKVRNALRKRFGIFSRLTRAFVYWSFEIRALGFVVNPKLLAREERAIRDSLAASVADPELRAKLTPAYRAGCKRVLISDDYYPALQRPNVELIDSPLAEIRERSVVSADGRERPADVIIYGTGFKATDGIVPLRVYGTGGVELGDVWREGMRAFLGTSVAGFPNLFFVMGPNTGLGHNSVVLMMEAQYAYILGALEYMRANAIRALDVKPEAQSAFNANLQRRMRRTVWSSGCSSWYLDERGQNTTLWPGFTFEFRQLTRRFEPSRYTSG